MNDFPRHVATRLFNAPIALLPAAAPLTLQLLERSIGGARDHGEGLIVLPDAGEMPVPFGTEASAYDMVDGVAIIRAHGILIQRIGPLWPYAEFFGATGYDRLRLQIMAALSDDDVDAIVFDIDSPGGEVAGCFDLADLIYEARGIKPMAAILGESAYSAAFAIASSVDPGKLWVPRTGGTGSVGVIYQHLSLAKWLANTGVTPTLVTKGAFKGEGSELFDLSKGALERLQADVDTVGDLFDDTVARNRGMAVKAVSRTEAGTFLGRKGVDVGFADAVASPDAAFRSFLAQLA